VAENVGEEHIKVKERKSGADQEARPELVHIRE
jgi:hypothetical protein